MPDKMTLSERFLAGFALAATIAKDPGAELARPGLCADRQGPVSATARELLELSKAERRARIRSWMQPKRGMWPSAPTAPLRAYGLLAQRTFANVRPDWLRSAPLPRPGYTPDPQLLELLQRIAAETVERPAGPHAAERQRERCKDQP